LLKDKLARFIDKKPEESKWHICEDVPDAYIKQMCGEAKILRTDRKSGKQTLRWDKVTPSTRVDFWDCEVYLMGAAEIKGVYNLTEDDKPKIYQPKEKDKKENWINETQGWLNV
jgi:hypothetical protein